MQSIRSIGFHVALHKQNTCLVDYQQALLCAVDRSGMKNGQHLFPPVLLLSGGTPPPPPQAWWRPSRYSLAIIAVGVVGVDGAPSCDPTLSSETLSHGAVAPPKDERSASTEVTFWL